jgi:hypothetical protein
VKDKMAKALFFNLREKRNPKENGLLLKVKGTNIVSLTGDEIPSNARLAVRGNTLEYNKEVYILATISSRKAQRSLRDHGAYVEMQPMGGAARMQERWPFI